jgi:hypothetical protein
MDEQTQPYPNIQQPIPEPTLSGTPPTNPQGQIPVRSKPNLTPVWIAVGVLVIVAAIFGATMVIVNSKPTTTVIIVTPTPVLVTPTPMRAVNPVATTSAFLELEKNVSDLSSGLNRLNLNDTNLYPPVLDLSLGFSN